MVSQHRFGWVFTGSRTLACDFEQGEKVTIDRRGVERMPMQASRFESFEQEPNFQRWAEAVIVEYAWMTDRPIYGLPNIQRFLQECFGAKVDPLTTAINLAQQLGAETYPVENSQDEQ